MRLELSLHLQHNHPLENDAEPAKHHQITHEETLGDLQKHIFRAAPHILIALDHSKIQKHKYQDINAILSQREDESAF